MASTVATSMAIVLNTKCFSTKSKSWNIKSKRPISLFSLQNLPKGLTATSTPPENAAELTAGVIFSTLSTANPAFAVQQLAEIADGDSRGLALLLPLIPALLWVLYNILQPALNQINKMRNSKGVIIGLGLGAASGFFHPAEASAAEIAAVAEAVSDNRGQLLLFVITPAILWVLYNILQPEHSVFHFLAADGSNYIPYDVRTTQHINVSHGSSREGYFNGLPDSRVVKISLRS